MRNRGYIVIFCVFTHTVLYNSDIMVSMLVNIATAENSLKVLRNPDFSTSLAYINIASSPSSDGDEPFQKNLHACLEIFSSAYRKCSCSTHKKRSLSWFKSYQIAAISWLIQNVNTISAWNLERSITQCIIFLTIDNMFPLKWCVVSAYGYSFFFTSAPGPMNHKKHQPPSSQLDEVRPCWSPRTSDSHIYHGVFHGFMVPCAATMNLYQEMFRNTVQGLSAFFTVSTTSVNSDFKETLNPTVCVNILTKFSPCFIYMLQQLYTMFWSTVLQTISFCTISALKKRQGTFFAHLNVLRASRCNFSDTSYFVASTDAIHYRNLFKHWNSSSVTVMKMYGETALMFLFN